MHHPRVRVTDRMEPMHRYSSIDRTDIDRDAPIRIDRSRPRPPDVDGWNARILDVDLNRAREDDAWANARAVDADARTRG